MGKNSLHLRANSGKTEGRIRPVGELTGDDEKPERCRSPQSVSAECNADVADVHLLSHAALEEYRHDCNRECDDDEPDGIAHEPVT
jgi:hypothetical protein